MDFRYTPEQERFRTEIRAFLRENVSDELRREVIGQTASKISAYPGVRQALVELQLSFRGMPGLVADGRERTARCRRGTKG